MITDASDASEWDVWSTRASLAVTDPTLLRPAREIVDEVIAEVDAACSRFRPDSELMQITGRTSRGVEVSPLLAAVLRAALDAALLTDGDVDPTVGRRLIELGYDRDLDDVRRVDGTRISVRRLAAPRSWRDVNLSGLTLTAPEDIVLDLGSVGKAFAADQAARAVAGELGCGVLVSLGGDITTAGAREEGAWQVLVEDVPGDPWQQVSLTPGWSMATSSTQKRRWRAGGRNIHHILDPRSGLPAPETWRTATVVAENCVRANALSTAAIVRGAAARSWLGREGVAARLVDSAGRVHLLGGWPEASVSSESVSPEGVLSDVR